MKLTQKQSARKFVEYWTFQRGSEKGEDQQFWNSLLGEVLGLEDIKSHVQYQVPVSMKGTAKYFDAETELYYYGYRFYSTALMRWINRDPIEEKGGLNLYGFCGNNGINKQDFLGMSCTLGTFNVLAISIASTPQSVKANLESLEKSSKELLEALERAGTGMSALSLATSTGFASLMLSLGDEMIAGNISPSIEDLRSAITSLFRKLRQTPLRLDGVLKWEKCECISGDTRWVRQSDIKESENVSFENIGINSAYSTDFRGAYKRLEKSLIRKLYDNLR